MLPKGMKQGTGAWRTSFDFKNDSLTTGIESQSNSSSGFHPGSRKPSTLMEGLPRVENPPAALVVLSDVATLVEISVPLIGKCRSRALGRGQV
jgi:hypothetical protein